MENDSIIIRDKQIIAFYRDNPQLDIVTINHVFINIIKQLSTNISDSMDHSVNNQILSIVKELKGDISTINLDILKNFHEMKKDYMESVKLLISNSELTQVDKFNQSISKNNDSLFDKIKLLMNDVLPKTSDKNYKQVEHCVRTFSTKITEDVQKSMKNNTLDGLLENIESYLDKMISTLETHIASSILNSESRTSISINKLHENFIIQKKVQDSLNTELCTFLNKYKSNSSVKGAISESELYFLLQRIVPHDELIRCSKDTASCDIRLNRKDKSLPSILFENKDYSTSVNTDEVEKFKRDLQRQKCHGIFISQNSPITFKENFHIDIINNLIHLYIPNAKYDEDKIKLAISIIDHLSVKLSIINSNGGNDFLRLTKEHCEEIKEDVRTFVNKKLEIIDMMKLFVRQMTDKLEEIHFPSIQKHSILSVDSKYMQILCPLCKKFVGKNRASTAAHMKKCSRNAPPDAIIVNTTVSQTNAAGGGGIGDDEDSEENL
jgi:hypothetical protein